MVFRPDVVKQQWRTSDNTYIEDITCPHVDTNFIFECLTRYLMSEQSERFRRLLKILRRLSEARTNFTYHLRQIPKKSEGSFNNLYLQMSRYYIKFFISSSHVKLSRFPSERNYCKSLKFIVTSLL